VLWLAEGTPWSGAALARFVPGRPATSLTLAQPETYAAGPATDSVPGRVTAGGEHVAVGAVGQAVVVAYTRRGADGAARLVLASTLGGSDRAAVAPLWEQPVAGRSPEVEFCEGLDRPTLLVAGAGEWLALSVGPSGVTELVRVAPPAGATFDERLAVRCTPSRLVAYGKERPRSSPVLVCGPGSAGCRGLAPPETPSLATLPLYTTRTPSGRALAHAEWPMVFDQTGGVLLAARATGSVVSLATRRLNGSGWEGDRVVFDAAAQAHGSTVEGLGLYADGADVLLAVATPDGLHLLQSRDRGASFR
jgi:hypothetical protein